MGVDFQAQLVVGVACDVRRMPIVVPKFDENTGKPYEKEVYEDRYVLYNVYDLGDSIEKVNSFGLAYFDRSSEDHDFYIVGTDVCSANEEEITTVEMAEIDAARHMVSLKLLSAGYSVPLANIKVYLIGYVGV